MNEANSIQVMSNPLKEMIRMAVKSAIMSFDSLDLKLIPSLEVKYLDTILSFFITDMLEHLIENDSYSLSYDPAQKVFFKKDGSKFPLREFASATYRRVTHYNQNVIIVNPVYP